MMYIILIAYLYSARYLLAHLKQLRLARVRERVTYDDSRAADIKLVDFNLSRRASLGFQLSRPRRDGAGSGSEYLDALPYSGRLLN
jgi:hypothetical protein